MKEKNLEEIVVKQNKVRVMKVGNVNYISLTDLAKYKDKERTDYIIQNWMRNTNSILYLGTWEYLYNEKFNSIEFDGFKNESGENSFVMTPKKWINSTKAIGVISKQGRYGGTFAHPDIAFEFASWLSPEFKLYLIKEFERLKAKEAKENKLDWYANRLLSKVNYLVHTDAIKNYIVPELTDSQKKYVYASEADLINVALFGMTSKEWRDNNPEIEGNIRDNTDLLHLVILNNLESINSELIKMNLSQEERLIKLNNSARRQLQIIKENNNVKELTSLQKEVNDTKYLLN